MTKICEMAAFCRFAYKFICYRTYLYYFVNEHKKSIKFNIKEVAHQYKSAVTSKKLHKI